uniref:RING-CH-type domain-containing protein n=1 Tax=Heliothis virescens TaxID=7102 RepID=A0A2A4IXU3_HELVI
MPNTRRRRFSVQNEIASRENKMQNGLQSSHSDPDSELKVATNLGATKSTKSKVRMFANSSRNSTLEIVAECDSASSVTTIRKRSCTTVDKDVTASSSNIALENAIKTAEDILHSDRSKTSTAIETQKKREEKQLSKEGTPLRRDKHPRQHRIKVRSPKRRMAIIEQQNKAVDSNRRTAATGAIDWDTEFDLCSSENVAAVIDTHEDDERNSTHSLDDMCRICHSGEALSPELGRLISACSCRGTVGRVHVKCLERWLTESGKSRCELCGTRYVTRRVHRYGVPRALVMWVLSQNAKQLMVDSLGIMLMSPLAVLAAWLSGRTLAGLMTQESHVTPWPLASTFVLACMTLVCYYCWIVSAATRHALGWWIWYRSQYEVRLQLQENDE